MKTVKLPESNRTREIDTMIVELVKEHSFKQNRLSAQVSQKMTDHYPSGKPNASLFDVEDFNFEDTKFENKRVAFVDVPLGTTLEGVTAQIAKLTAAGKFPCIQKVMSLKPILSEDQKAGIAAGKTTLDIIAAKQLARKQVIDPVTKQPVKDGEGKVVTEQLFYGENKLPFYRVNVFQPDFVEDIDTRKAEESAMVQTSVEVAEARAE